MTIEEKRIAIAEACGWRKAEPPNTPVWWKNGEWSSNVYDLPDYLNDLNAMHEAEKVLTLEHRIKYLGHLTQLDHYGRLATAAQRADAFLLTLNLMKP